MSGAVLGAVLALICAFVGDDDRLSENVRSRADGVFFENAGYHRFVNLDLKNIDAFYDIAKADVRTTVPKRVQVGGKGALQFDSNITACWDRGQAFVRVREARPVCIYSCDLAHVRLENIIENPHPVRRRVPSIMNFATEVGPNVVDTSNFDGVNIDVHYLQMQMRSNLRLADFAGNADGINRSLSCPLRSPESLLNENEADACNAQSYKAESSHAKSPESHISLGLQVLLGSVGIACGFFYLIRAFRKIDALNIATLTFYAFFGPVMIGAGFVIVGYGIYMLVI